MTMLLKYRKNKPHSTTETARDFQLRTINITRTAGCIFFNTLFFTFFYSFSYLKFWVWISTSIIIAKQCHLGENFISITIALSNSTSKQWNKCVFFHTQCIAGCVSYPECWLYALMYCLNYISFFPSIFFPVYVTLVCALFHYVWVLYH